MPQCFASSWPIGHNSQSPERESQKLTSYRPRCQNQHQQNSTQYCVPPFWNTNQNWACPLYSTGPVWVLSTKYLFGSSEIYWRSWRLHSSPVASWPWRISGSPRAHDRVEPFFLLEFRSQLSLVITVLQSSIPKRARTKLLSKNNSNKWNNYFLT